MTTSAVFKIRLLAVEIAHSERYIESKSFVRANLMISLGLTLNTWTGDRGN